MNNFLFICFAFLSVSAFSIELTDYNTIESSQYNSIQKMPDTPNIGVNKNNISSIPNDFSYDDLKNNIYLTEKILKTLLLQNNTKFIPLLIKIYETFPNRDPILLDFANAQMAKLNGNFEQSINLYREILARNPSLSSIRFALAITLFENKQNSLAKEQFEKVRSDNKLPNTIKAQVESYLQSIEKQSDWKFNATISYLNEKNVNNASDTAYIPEISFLGIPLQKYKEILPQKAKGMSYSISLSKDFNLQKNHYITFDQQFYSKNYWTNHSFDDTNLRTSLGYAYKDALSIIKITPFYALRWYGNHRYSKSGGLHLSYRKWLTSHLQYSASGEYALQRYNENKALNGVNYQLSSTLLWQKDPTQFSYLGIDYYRENTRVKQYSNDRSTLRVGWEKHWKLAGLSNHIFLSASYRKYKDKAKIGVFPLGKTRADKIYTATLMLWKRDWHLWYITPKVVLKWHKQYSNIPSLYQYTDKNINMIFETEF
ncbi:porin family protein [Otariodibacter sp.]|uniref:porin family protein n=1 Tax=Otariodibacter sp. TaxID=3030919 RepID=UPI002612C527|nr:porin family protein [Otariodibacter sp.]